MTPELSTLTLLHLADQLSSRLDPVRLATESRSRWLVRLRTVLTATFADAGKSSPRKSATLPNGSRAAILAVRYLSSGVMGLRFVKRVEYVRFCEPVHGQPLNRRIRIGTLP